MTDTRSLTDDISPPDRVKRAEQIATSIEDEILSGRWSIGHRIGNEAELARDNGVSRWTMREALAILEQAGTVVSRRGAGGGLFVAAPALDLVRNSIGAFLEFSAVPFEAVSTVRLALVRAATPLAAARLAREDRVALARMVLDAEQPGVPAIEAMGAARELLRDTAGNRLLALFMAVLADVGMHSCWMSALDDEAFVAMIDRLTAATRRYCLSVLADDVERAMAAERESMAIAAELHAASSMSGDHRSAPNAIERAYALYPSARPAKKAERVAWAVRRQIIDEHLPVGANLGSEAVLMARHGVGRPVLREAIRMVERLGLVDMRRGGASGLTVIAPAPARIINLARDFLRRDPPSPQERSEVVKVLRSVDPANTVVALMLSIIKD